MTGRYAKFYDLTRLYPTEDGYEDYVEFDILDEYNEAIRNELRINPIYLDGDIIFIGSTYETRQEYGFATITENGTNFQQGEYPKMDAPGVFYKKTIDEINAFWMDFVGVPYFDEEDDLLIDELRKSGNYFLPKDLWKGALPKAKKKTRKINKLRVYLNETQGFPPNVADQISRKTYEFGKKKKNSSLSSINKIIFYLKKLK